MARKARQCAKDGGYHIIISSEKNMELFKETEDKEKFLDLLLEYQDVCSFKLYGYSIVNSHAHLLLISRRTPIARIVSRLGTSYVAWYNHKYNRSGSLFDDRFKSEVVDDEETFKKVLRYVNLNPQIEGVVDDIACYAYTSYNTYFQNEYVESDLARRIFGSVQDFKSYHEVDEIEKCLDIKVKKSITDAELELVLNEKFGVAAITVGLLKKDEITSIVMHAFKLGATLRQIARITKISTSKIYRYKDLALAKG